MKKILFLLLGIPLVLSVSLWAGNLGSGYTAGSGITITNGAIINADKGTTAVVGTAGKVPMFTGTNAVGDSGFTDTQNRTRHLPFSIMDANTLPDTTIFIRKIASAITITNLHVSCITDPDTEIAGNLEYCDDEITMANPVVINSFDTTAGVRDDATIDTPAVPTGKCVYIDFTATPIAAIKQIFFDITYTVN